MRERESRRERGRETEGESCFWLAHLLSSLAFFIWLFNLCKHMSDKFKVKVRRRLSQWGACCIRSRLWVQIPGQHIKARPASVPTHCGAKLGGFLELISQQSSLQSHACIHTRTCTCIYREWGKEGEREMHISYKTTVKVRYICVLMGILQFSWTIWGKNQV